MAPEGVPDCDHRFQNASLDWPDIEYHFVSGGLGTDEGLHLRHIFGLRDEYWYNYLEPISKRVSANCHINFTSISC